MPTLPATASIVSPVSPREWIARSIRYRPLLWSAPAFAAGCALGPGFAAWSGARGRDDLALYWPLWFACAALLGALLQRSRAYRWRLLLACALLVLGMVHGARRVLMPPANIALLVRDQPGTHTRSSLSGPLEPVPVTLTGWVAAPTERGDYYTEFPLQCQPLRLANGRRLHGRVWVRVPLEARVEVGDRVSFATELRDLPRVGSPGERTRDWPYLRENCWCLARVKEAAQIKVLQRAERYPLSRAIVRWRQRLVRHYERAFASEGPVTAPASPYPYATAQLVAAMVFGEGGLTQSLPPLTRNQFRTAGLSHLLVASGAQVALVSLGLLGLMHLFGLRRWWAIAIIVPLLMAYILLAGGSASIWRAGIAALCVTWAILLGRDADGVSLWALALGLLLVIDPANLFDLSFQLTFAATWGLLCLSPLFLRFLQKLFGVSTTIEVAALTLAAQVATLPLLLYQFGQLSIAGFGCNLLAVPVAGLLVATGIAGLGVPLIDALNYHLAQAIAVIAAVGAQMPGAQLRLALWPSSRMLFCYLLLGSCTLLPLFSGFDWQGWRAAARDELGRWWQKRAARPLGRQMAEWSVLPAVIVLLLFVWQATARRDGKLHVAVLDVGQGESLVIKSPAGRIVLIDGGSTSLGERGDVGRSVIVPYLQYIGARKIDVMVVTHADVDHCNALENVLREVPVDLVLDGAAASDAATLAAAPEYQALQRALALRHVPVRAARAGQRLDLGDGVTLRVLSPQVPLLRDDNNDSAVLRLDYGAVGMLFTADIEAAAEARLLQSGTDLHCQVLKVAHHGSDSSSSAAFLAAAHPQAAVISCGRYNRFHHPAPQTLRSLGVRHIPVFRTDLDGTIEITSDGKTCSLQPFR